MLQKISIASKNTSNKNCSDLNFLRKSQGAHMPISPRSRARGLPRSVYVKYYYVLKWESRSTSGLNAAKIIDYNKKCIK